MLFVDSSAGERPSHLRDCREIISWKSFAVEAASVLELRGDGTGDFKHFVRNAKKKAEKYPARKDQQGRWQIWASFCPPPLVFCCLPVTRISASPNLRWRAKASWK
jgi:hypothetical protein